MNQHDETVYLHHIYDAILKLEEYVKEIDEESFKYNSLIQDGVIRQLQIIGEAVKGLSHDTRNKHPHIPWKDIAGM
jgi:uncharacterized protein with HEPN domain